jgi:protein TonB
MSMPGGGLALWYAPWRVSPLGLALVVAAHVALLLVLLLVRATPPQAPAAVLSVSLLPLAPEPLAEPVLQPKPQPQPQPQPRQAAPRPVRLAVPADAPVAPTPARVEPVPVVEAQPTPVAPVAATPAAAQAVAAPAPTPAPQPPRFDADYLDNPKPHYPALSRRMGEEGRVLLRVRVDARGEALTVDLHTSSGSPRLDQAAQDVVRRWRFVPARLGSEAVAATVLVPIAFSLKD